MKRNILLFILLHLCLNFVSKSQSGYFTSFKMEEPGAWYPYKIVYQLGETVGLKYMIGEISNSSSINPILWDGFIDTLPNHRFIYINNSSLVVDTIHTFSFVIHNGDTLKYFSLFEASLNDTSNWENFRIPYGLNYRLELVKYPTNICILGVDTLVITPVDSVQHYATQMYNQMAVSEEKTKNERKFIITDLTDSIQVRLRLTPIFIGPFADRAMIVQDKWYPRYSLELKDSLSIYSIVRDSLLQMGIHYPEILTYQKQSNEIPSDTKLIQITSYPNPSSDKLVVKFNLPDEMEVSCKLIDVSGRTMWQRSFGLLGQGEYTLNLPSAFARTGVYFFVLKTSIIEKIIKLNIVK